MSITVRPIDIAVAESTVTKINAYWKARGHKANARTETGAVVISDLGPGGLPKNFLKKEKIKLTRSAKQFAEKHRFAPAR